MFNSKEQTQELLNAYTLHSWILAMNIHARPK
jgi:hypothetical protein